MEKKKCFLGILVIALVCIFNSCASLNYPQPEFDKPFVYVIDTFKAKGSFEDYVKLHNVSNDSNIKFRVYIHQPKNNEWIVYGIGSLKGSGDTDTINSNIKSIDDYRYFAIESMDKINYRYEFYKSRNDLHINIIND